MGALRRHQGCRPDAWGAILLGPPSPVARGALPDIKGRQAMTVWLSANFIILCCVNTVRLQIKAWRREREAAAALVRAAAFQERAELALHEAKKALVKARAGIFN
jgi:hypothetical protein